MGTILIILGLLVFLFAIACCIAAAIGYVRGRKLARELNSAAEREQIRRKVNLV